MITRDDMAKACRDTDNKLEEGDGDLEAWARDTDVDLKGMMEVAEQRAIRAAMVLQGEDPRKRSTIKATVVELDPEIQVIIPLLMSMWLDAFAICLEVKDGR